MGLSFRKEFCYETSGLSSLTWSTLKVQNSVRLLWWTDFTFDFITSLKIETTNLTWRRRCHQDQQGRNCLRSVRNPKPSGKISNHAAAKNIFTAFGVLFQNSKTISCLRKRARFSKPICSSPSFTRSETGVF